MGLSRQSELNHTYRGSTEAALLRKGVNHEFTPAMEVNVRQILAELTAPPILVFPG